MESTSNTPQETSAKLPDGMKRIVVAAGSPPINKAFVGRWLVGDKDHGMRAEQADNSQQDWDAGAEWSVALTRRGKLVVCISHCNNLWETSMNVHENFDELKDEAELPQNVLAATAEELGVPYEIDLDI